MFEHILEIFQHPDALKYASIPVIAGFIGWGTNWLAIKLMFHPLEFVGYKPLYLGWQGIIPARAEKMARIVVDKALNNLIEMEEIFEALDNEKITQHVYSRLRPQLESLTDEIMEQEHAILWQNLPRVIKRRLMNKVDEMMPTLIGEMLEEAERNAERLVDMEGMVIKTLTEDKSLLNQIFMEAGEKELKFVINTGAYCGFAFGLLQMLVWILLPQWWVLPAFGLLVGYATNAIALKLIFEPLEPKKIGPFTLQGLFLKRQAEISIILCQITTQKVFTLANLFDEMINGTNSKRTEAMITRYIKRAIDEVSSGMGVGLGVTRVLAQATLGLRGYARLKATAADTAISIAQQDIIGDDPALNKSQMVRVEALLVERMVALSPEEFAGIFHPVFEQDEWILITVGAVLGLISGIVQLVWMFGGSVL